MGIADILANNVTMNNDNGDNKVIYNDNVTMNNDSRSADLIADTLVAKLNNPGARSFYCKVAYKLSEAKIYANLEQAMKGRSPQKLFTWLCSKDMK